jgi:hypothetical protein
MVLVVALGSALGRFLAGCLGWISGIVADLPDDKPSQAETTPRGNEYNYRTGRFDNGTDPCGIYQSDDGTEILGMKQD